MNNIDNNPLLQDWNTPYQTPPFRDIKVSHFIPAIEYALEKAYKNINKIIESREAATFENTVVALENSSTLLDRVTSVLFNLNHAETSDKLQEAASEASPLLSKFSNFVALNKELFAKVKSVYDNRELNVTDREDLVLLEKTYSSFVRNGANIESDSRVRYEEINTQLSKLSLKFGENVLKETNSYSLNITNREDLDGIPETILESAAETAKERSLDGWVFTLDAPSMGAFLKYATNRELREQIYKASAYVANQDNEFNNSKNVIEIANLRLEKANILGYSSYAEYVLEKRMAKEIDTVNDFIAKLHQRSKPQADNEYLEVNSFAKSSEFKGDKLEPWDWSFYSEKLKEERYGFNEEETKPYFELAKVQAGIFELADRLYGIKFEKIDSIQTYHEDVDTYKVLDSNSDLLAIFYTDFFPREGKSGGAWMTDYREQSNISGDMIRPLIQIVCNFSKPTATKPSLLTFGEVTTFLHEFGHAIHGIVANSRYGSSSGTSVYRDFVELPSQIMENWAFEKEWLDLFAVHYKNGEKIPQQLIDKIISSKNYLEGYQSERQLSFGAVDMGWHSVKKPITESPIEFEKEKMGPMNIFTPVENSCFSARFSHIFAGGYAAGYYGYKWAEVLDADAFEAFLESGDIFNKEIASRFRKELLEKGGTEHPMDLYIKFRGKEPSIDALLKRSGL